MTMDFDDWDKAYTAKMDAGIAGLSPRWGVRGYKAHNTHDGVAFVFTLTDAGKPVATVEDSGQGGGPHVYWKPQTLTARGAWEQEAEALFGDDWLAGEDMVEALLQKLGK